MSINSLATEIHRTAIQKGWWAGEGRDVGTVLCLIHSEVSEALEEWRNGYGFTEIRWEPTGAGRTKPEGFPIEMADVIIRVLDACARWHIDIDDAVSVKMAYNETRPFRHGGKIA